MKTNRHRSGQAIIFLVFVVVILFFVVIWNFDLHRILYVKNISQNGGDSAALMGARWQSISLNLIGDLNIMHALALASGDTDKASSITNIQARLCYAGPMVAFIACQQAAKNNKIYQNQSFTDYMAKHARRVREDYPSETGSDGEALFPEPYPNCWSEYADMLDLAVEDGIAVGPDNVHFYGDSVAGGHTLTDYSFYNAIAGRSWCWFYSSGPTLLEEYSNFYPCWWTDLPVPAHPMYMNSEIFALGLRKVTTTLDQVVQTDKLSKVAEDRKMDPPGSSASDASANRMMCFVCA